MKRTDLMKQIRQMLKDAGVEGTPTEGSNHTKWAIGANRVPVPRHTEIADNFARTILNQVASAIAATKDGDDDATDV